MSLYRGLGKEHAAERVEAHVAKTREFLAALKAAEYRSDEWIAALGGLIALSEILAESASDLAAELKEPKA